MYIRTQNYPSKPLVCVDAAHLQGLKRKLYSLLRSKCGIPFIVE